MTEPIEKPAFASGSPIEQKNMEDSFAQRVQELDEKKNIAPTAEQTQVETLKNEKEKIQGALKETEQQKAEALKKLEDSKKDPQWWEQHEVEKGKENKETPDESKN